MKTFFYICTLVALLAVVRLSGLLFIKWIYIFLPLILYGVYNVVLVGVVIWVLFSTYTQKDNDFSKPQDKE